MDKWTENDDGEAYKQGWAIATLDDGSYTIQCIDDLEPGNRFESDAMAVAFVNREAAHGDKLAQKALVLAIGTGIALAKRLLTATYPPSESPGCVVVPEHVMRRLKAILLGVFDLVDEV